MNRIGIMGGTFNPIHNGHLAIAEKAREQFALEKVLFMPSGLPYMKDQREVLPIGVRCEMTALAVADNPFFELSTLEAADAEQGKNTYTYETLQKLRRMDSKAAYFFILGADSLDTIENWKNPSLIFENCTLLAAVRTEKTPAKTRPLRSFGPAASERTERDTDRASSRDRLLRQAEYLRKKYRASVEILEFSGMDISSTQLRELTRRGESLQGLVPEAVERYILANECYR